VHRFVPALCPARAQSAEADGARARNRLKNCTRSMTPRHHRISSPFESTSRRSERVLIPDRSKTSRSQAKRYCVMIASIRLRARAPLHCARARFALLTKLCW
jgi:hypothetical protein